ncbi:sulfite exporter TauE/SafE family protein [Octadecabacter sp. G9-8]|uniref:Probable membrane transporter protein n=1 Tax=Octadecabacter dasysiphoniae TaxID=2909341 RepID=A0ABS9CQS6_9RHOB|nr:sulfite exporter TauE/SafE family protein [Octadecabacter dasysiphoniae]MCF2869588.1 sulfite exporter TauE/SafE family protein [Octadecabacter dasysiphoniae]
MDGTLFWTLGVVAAFCVGLSKGGAPAFGTLAVPILSLTISPIAAAGLLLPVFVFSDVFGIWAYRKHANWALLKIAAVGIVVGTGVGWATAHLVSEQMVRLLIGVIGFLFALNFLLRAQLKPVERPATVPGGLFWTAVAGFTSFVSHAGAPPWQVWVLPQKLPKMVFAGTSTFAFAIMNALKIVPYYVLGQLQADNLRITLILFVPALVGVFVAYRLIRILPERVFYGIVTWMLLIVSIKLIWDGAGL